LIFPVLETPKYNKVVHPCQQEIMHGEIGLSARLAASIPVFIDCRQTLW
jgi:hypothetical protein